MPRIEMENDDHTFVVQVKDKATVCVDAFELSGVMLESGFSETKEPTVDNVDEMMRTVAWAEGDGDLENVTKYEMFAVASKVLTRMGQLGND